MPKIRNIIIFVAIGAILILVYVFFIKPSPEEASLVSSTSTGTLPEAGGGAGNTLTNSISADDFLNLLLSVRSIKLDSSILSDVAFNSLRDSSITLTPDGNEGRPNPFAQFGNDVAPSTTTGGGASSAATTPAAPTATTTPGESASATTPAATLP